jgi:hypothetical protein
MDKIINKWECSKFELILTQNKRGGFVIDINTKDNHETAYCYEYKDKKEAEAFFESMWKHIFIV